MLRESDEKLHAVFESMLDGILIADTETRRFVAGNQAICRMLGYSLEELMRLGVADIHPPQDLPHVIEQFEGQLRGGPNLAVDIPVRRKDGSLFYADINAAPVNFGGKNCLVGIFRDTTGRKQIETELKENQQLLRELAAQDVKLREAECRHIAREVHDELGQLLTALRMDISLLRIQFGKRDPLLMEKIKNILVLADKAIQGVRDVTANLRPAALDMGVVPAIAWLCDRFPGHTDTACTLRVVDEPVELDEESTVAVFRIVQESLTNVARYAAANSVEITIGLRGDHVAVEVRDNGKGFDPAAIAAKDSFGLMSMRERAQAVGGKVEITSAPAKGTVVSVRIPIKPGRDIP